MTRGYAVAVSPGDGHNRRWRTLPPMSWDALVDWLDLENPADHKDCGAYVLGTIEGNARNKESVTSRSGLALDADHLTPGQAETLVDTLRTVLPFAAVVYPTFRSTPEEPRRRVVLPLSRDVSSSEYVRVSRYVRGLLDLPEDVWDAKASESAVQLMLRPSTQDTAACTSVVIDGSPLDVEAALAAVPPEPEPEPRVVQVPDTPPTGPELARASWFLERAERSVPELVGTDGKPRGGRNEAVLSSLGLLFDFVKGGCLDYDDVLERVWEASLRAPGDDRWNRREFERVAGNAWNYATPDRPIIEDGSEFDSLPPIETDFGAIDPGWPGQFIDKKRGLLTETLAAAVREHLTIAVGEIDDHLYLYRHGVYRPDRREVGTVVSLLLGEEFRPAHLATVREKLRYDPRARLIDCGPTPAWVNVRNGLIDWRTGELHPHTPDVLSVVQLPVEYDPDARCPEFERFIAEVLPADLVTPTEDGPGFIWELLAYFIFSGNPFHLAVLFRGTGRNGKGVLLRVVERLLGIENLTAVTLHDLIENRFRAADLFGRIANIAGDLDPKWLDATAKFKAITGGDKIAAERKYGATFAFTPWAVPIYSANKPFGSADSSDGYFARWVVVPFPRSFLGREDRGLDARLGTRDELEGVLARAVAALPVLMARGRLPEPASVAAAKEEFVRAGDQVRAWLDSRCELKANAWTRRTALYTAYELDEDIDHRSLLSKREFYARLEQISAIRPRKKDGYDGFSGIGLKEPG